jgi:CHAD domain-containing protein
MTVRPVDLLGRPAAQSVRLIAMNYLDEAGQGLERLTHPEDTEALHDFRVALRRLRTTLRAYRPQLEGSVPRRLRRKLRDVAEATNSARDAEVALTWLRPLEAEVSKREQAGLRWLIERIERGHGRDLPLALGDARRSFVGVERKLRKGLEVYHRTVPVQRAKPEERFAAVASTALRDQALQVDQLLATIASRDDDAIHQARIAAKRLRYMLEPLSAVLDGGADLVQRLKQLQDNLGELHDLSVLEEEVRIALEAAAVARAGRIWELTLDDEPEPPAIRAAQRRRQNPGLFAVAQRSRVRREMLFRQLKAEWLEGGGRWADALTPALVPLATHAGSGGAVRRSVLRPRAIRSRRRSPTA